MSINTSSTRAYYELPTTRLKPEQKQQLEALLPGLKKSSKELIGILGSYQSVTSQLEPKHTYYSLPTQTAKAKYNAALDQLRQKCGQPSSSSTFDHLPPPPSEWIQQNPKPPKRVQFNDRLQIKEFHSFKPTNNG